MHTSKNNLPEKMSEKVQKSMTLNPTPKSRNHIVHKFDALGLILIS